MIIIVILVHKSSNMKYSIIFLDLQFTYVNIYIVWTWISLILFIFNNNYLYHVSLTCLLILFILEKKNVSYVIRFYCKHTMLLWCIYFLILFWGKPFALLCRVCYLQQYNTYIVMEAQLNDVHILRSIIGIGRHIII